MLYFSPLSVKDDEQRDRNHPFSFPQCRQSGQNGWVGATGGWGTWPGGRFREMIDSDGGGAMQAGQESCITVPSTEVL